MLTIFEQEVTLDDVPELTVVKKSELALTLQPYLETEVKQRLNQMIALQLAEKAQHRYIH